MGGVAPFRPALRYMGGKWRLAPWIVSHFPAHRTYVEPFGGAASVLLRKPRSYAEIYNDLDGEVVNLFRVLRDPQLSARLVELVSLTPFAREEFELTYEVATDPVENARRLVARSYMGHGSTAVALRRRTGFRADSNRSGTTPAQDWANLPPGLAAISERLRAVVIEQRPASSIIERFDADDTLIYADPPYVHATRSRRRVRGALEHAYSHELTDADHARLLKQLVACRSMVALSGYASDLYDAALGGGGLDPARDSDPRRRGEASPRGALAERRRGAGDGPLRSARMTDSYGQYGQFPARLRRRGRDDGRLTVRRRSNCPARKCLAILRKRTVADSPDGFPALA